MDLARVGTGATPSRSQLEFWENGTIPWITSSVVNYSQVTKYSELITEKALLKTNCKLVPKGTIIMALYGEGKTRGKVSVLKIEAATNQALATIITNSNVLYNIFLKWFFVYSYELTRLKSSGGVQPNINLSIVKNTVIPLPPLPEQHRIVEEIETRLSVCDNVLANIDEALNKSQALRQSILKQAFEGKLLSDEELEDCRRDPDWEPAEKLLDRIMNQKPARV
jgi:type I restriction enzyme S subunit